MYTCFAYDLNKYCNGNSNRNRNAGSELSKGASVSTNTIPGVPHKRFTLRLKIAQNPYIVWSLGPNALKYESLKP